MFTAGEDGAEVMEATRWLHSTDRNAVSTPTAQYKQHAESLVFTGRHCVFIRTLFLKRKERKLEEVQFETHKTTVVLAVGKMLLCFFLDDTGVYLTQLMLALRHSV